MIDGSGPDPGDLKDAMELLLRWILTNTPEALMLEWMLVTRDAWRAGVPIRHKG